MIRVSKFIFDCGHTGVAWENADKLPVDLSSVDFVVLSHSHYDHAGGFPFLLKYCHPQAVYIGRNFWQEKFSYDKENNQYLPKGCGFTKSDLVAWKVEERECKDNLQLFTSLTASRLLCVSCTARAIWQGYGSADLSAPCGYIAY